jgi:hypothetical protein
MDFSLFRVRGVATAHSVNHLAHGIRRGQLA